MTPDRRQSLPRRWPFTEIDLRTAQGCRIRDLYIARMDKIGSPDEVVLEAAVLKVAKLQVIVERLHDELLAGKKHNKRLGGELVRHENMFRRAQHDLDVLLDPKLEEVREAEAERQADELRQADAERPPSIDDELLDPIKIFQREKREREAREKAQREAEEKAQ